MEEISKLLNTYQEDDQVGSSRQQYVERVENNQVIRAWNFFLEGRHPGNNGLRQGTNYNNTFLNAYQQALDFANGGERPNYPTDLLHKETPSCRCTIHQCMQQLQGG